MGFRVPVLSNPMTAAGDIIRGGAGGAPVNLPIGTAGQVLTVAAGLPTWAAAGGFANPMTTNGDLITQAAGVPARVGIGSAGQVLTVTAGAPAWATPAAGGAGVQYQFALPGNASSTPGLLSKANSSTGNPGGLKPTTSSGDPGINNGGPDPYIARAAVTITSATLKVAHAAVATGTAGGAMIARFDLYRVDYSTRTLIGSLNFPITSAGVFNNLGGNNFQVSTLTGLSLALAQGDCFGVEFLNLGGTDNQINALGGVWLCLEGA